MKLETLRKKVIACNRCPASGKSNIGQGTEECPDLLLIGTAPKLGVDGQFRLGRGYTRMVALLDKLKIGTYFLDNIVRCQLQSDRQPFQHEIDNCSEYTQQLILILKPKLVVAVGKKAEEVLGPVANAATIHPTATMYNKDRAIEFVNQLFDLKQLIKKRR